MSNVKKYLVWSVIALLVSYGLVIFNALSWLPINFYFFIALALILFIISLKYYQEMFWIFIVTLPLENIIVSPEQIPFSLRPYQFIGAILFLAVITIWFRGKLNFPLLSFKKICLVCRLKDKASCEKVEPEKAFNFFDRLIFILPVFALLAIINAPDKTLSLKLAIILISFIVLYWLGRNFLQTKKQRYEALWFFVIGSKAVILFGLYQAVAKKAGWSDFQVMDGRVNSTFTEPDWLGVYLAFLLAVIFWLRLAFQNFRDNIKIASWNFNRVVQIFLSVYFFFIFLTLFLTVSRSAWLGFAGVISAYYLAQLLSYKFPVKNYQFRYRWIIVSMGTTAMIMALAIFTATAFNLSSFHFANRLASSFSGKQKITVSCLKDSNLPQEIENINQLPLYNCKHINLEEIEKEKAMGFEVKEIYRNDPNVGIRKNIYKIIWKEIGRHPVIGQGLGSSGIILGQDERGADLNASNIFLETWLSMGILGLLILITIFAYPLAVSVKKILSENGGLPELFLTMTLFGFLIPNLFNAGLMLGFFWIWLAAMGVFWRRGREV